MKAIRTVSFLFALTILVGVIYLVTQELIEVYTVAEALKAVFDDPSILQTALYDGLGGIGFNYQFFAEHGPIVAVFLLIALLINSIT